MLEETLLDWWNGARDAGRTEGQLKGKQQLLLRLLEKRFGRLPRKALRKVEAILADNDLDILFDRALTAGSLAELGLS